MNESAVTSSALMRKHEKAFPIIATEKACGHKIKR